jgi:hypothetical protein
MVALEIKFFLRKLLWVIVSIESVTGPKGFSNKGCRIEFGLVFFLHGLWMKYLQTFCAAKKKKHPTNLAFC